VPALEQIVDRLDDRGRSRQAGAFLAQPSLQFGEERSALLLPDAQALVGAGAVDGALDIEQRVDALHRLQRDRRDCWRCLAAPRIGGDIGQFEELAARMRPAERRVDRALRSRWIIQPVIAGIGVGLQDAGKSVKMPIWMLLPTIPRSVIECSRRRSAAERAIVADIGPDVAGDSLALGQDWHGSVVAMEPLGGQHMRFDQGMQRGKRRRAGSDLVRQRRHAEVDAFSGEAVALPVQRLVLSEFVEQDHRQQVRPGKATRRHMERRRWLGDGLARPAGEPLTDCLDDLPAARDYLQRLGDILAEFRQLRRPAARARSRSWNDHTLAREMFREWLA
jgi:hypothetical protein